MGILKNWEVESRLILKKAQLSISLVNWGGDSEIQPIDQHLKTPISHLFHELGKIGKSNLEQQSNISIFIHISISIGKTGISNPLGNLRKTQTFWP